MIIQAKNNQFYFLRKLNLSDIDNLYCYLQNLSTETKNKFGPHRFDKDSLWEFYGNNSNVGYIAQDDETKKIIAYSIIKTGYLEHDFPRLQSYGITLSHLTDCTFAPSVADDWQSFGVGNNLFKFICSDLQSIEIKRIILWGGVQAENLKAINYYKRNGFYILGQFSYNGENYDMCFDIP